MFVIKLFIDLTAAIDIFLYTELIIYLVLYYTEL